MVLAGFLTACSSSDVKEAPAPAQAPPPDANAQVTDPALLPPGDGGLAGLPYGATAVPPEIVNHTRVALLLPLSGPHREIGTALLESAQLALFDVADENLALVVRDTKGTAPGAQEALSSALEAGCTLVLGPLFSTSVTAIAADAREAGVSIIAFSNDTSVAGIGIFLMGIAPSIQVDRIIDYAAEQGLSRFSVLVADTAYGHAVIRHMQEATWRNQVELARTVLYDPASNDISAEVRTLASFEERQRDLEARRKELARRGDEASAAELRRLENVETLGPPDFDALLLPESSNRLRSAAALLPFYDIDPGDVQLLGTVLWDDPILSQEPALHGGWFSAPQPEAWQFFRTRYRQAFEQEPPRIASLAYDATALASALVRQAAARFQPADFSAPSITQPSGFAGIDGIFRFRASGEIERGLAVLEMRPGKFEVREAAPSSFGPLTN